jgi:hypothetical protein
MSTMTATTRRPKGRSTEERQAAAQALRDRLAKFTEEADPALLAMLAARFAGYSERNAWLIGMQDPDATVVRGYEAWRAEGRQVTAGPNGIQIVSYAGDDAPKGEAEKAPAKDGEETEKVNRWFRPAYVFDIRNTEPIVCEECGEPIRRTGYDKTTRRNMWVHFDAAITGHDARPPRRETPAEVAA